MMWPVMEATETVEQTKQRLDRTWVPIEGLCRDCDRANTCTFPRNPSRPIWSCDEFESSDQGGPHRMTQPSAACASSEVLPGQIEAPEIRGLCRECDRRFTCEYPKPPEGVWHCDELE